MKTGRKPAQAPLTEAHSSKFDSLAPDRRAELEWLHQSIPNEPVRIQELIQNELTLVNSTLHDKKIRLECNLSENLPPVMIQPPSMRQALLGIIDIAIHGLSEGVIEINAEIDQAQMSIIFEATGNFDPPFLKKIIQGRKSVLDQLIGLSGARLSFSTKGLPDTPFTTVISIPVKDMVTIMVIDDNGDTLQFIERCLTGTRYLFLPVRDAEKALEMAIANSPDVILLDVMLPKMDGWELLRRLKANPKTA